MSYCDPRCDPTARLHDPWGGALSPHRRGLAAFKLDHAQAQVPDMRITQRELNTVDTWLSTMTRAAAKHGISKQFGGAVSSMFLHSVTLPSVHSARVGEDYIPVRFPLVLLHPLHSHPARPPPILPSLPVLARKCHQGRSNVGVKLCV